MRQLAGREACCRSGADRRRSQPGSTDATLAELVRARERHGDHVRIIAFRRNYGQTAAMSAGIDAARGELIDEPASFDPDISKVVVVTNGTNGVNVPAGP